MAGGWSVRGADPSTSSTSSGELGLRREDVLERGNTYDEWLMVKE